MASASNAQWVAVIELLCAATLWGFGFIASRWALSDIGPLWLTSMRFLLLVILLSPFVAFFAKYQIKAIIPGTLLGLGLLFQNYGLLYTPVANSAFITVLYVLFVPPLEWCLLKRRVPPLHFLFVVLSLLGVSLLCKLERAIPNIGDGLTLVSALLFSGHFIALAKVSPTCESPFLLNISQSLWAGLTCASIALPFERLPTPPYSNLAIIGISFLVLGSTLLGFMLQVRAQRSLSPSLASILCLLESPFAALFAFTILGESLMPSQTIGTVLILLSAFGAMRIKSPE